MIIAYRMSASDTDEDHGSQDLGDGSEEPDEQPPPEETTAAGTEAQHGDEQDPDDPETTPHDGANMVRSGTTPVSVPERPRIPAPSHSYTSTLCWIVVFLVGYTASCWIMYLLSITYGPAVITRMADLGWISIDYVPICEWMSMQDCVSACECQVCLGPPPPHLADMDVHSWRCIGMDEFCDQSEITSSEGCQKTTLEDIDDLVNRHRHRSADLSVNPVYHYRE